MNKFASIIAFLFISCFSYAQAYHTKALSPEIYTIQVNRSGNWDQIPVMALNGNDYIKISFDRISENSFDRLRYKIHHCDAYWKRSNGVSEIDYLDGFNDNPINDYAPSINTTVEYTHFNLTIPNRDVSLKLSGNYVVEVYDEDDPDTILLIACFSVVDPLVTVAATVSANTDIDTNKNHQQLSFTILHQNMNIRDPFTEIMAFVQQNNRLDNERLIIKPTYINPGKLIYEHNKDLIFKAGNEYRRFETSSYRYSGMNVKSIEYRRPDYIMNIETDLVRADRSYSYDQDQNGKVVIRNADSQYPETEADYFITNFTLAMDHPILEDIYINGIFTDNTFNDKYKLKYDNEDKAYHLSLLLKQGMYNYLYLTKEGDKYSTTKVEGDYYQTENEYSVYVYYRPNGQRYDSLIGVQTIQSRPK
ncbi:DUF5103 domain-containing protein [Dysgonomonas sp. Marseille-P4677]|uniref:type IX secretion system plug protein n=1 Tax=Dysgonomonas sp. Marseille-P4677 TaxID=2364790 RepID=UPI001911558A|nr:DUF5103 domain-containing protein [Dysgonomonas sp. Marseille-P4677]MBK5721956.1 DUF5103 domain-containing protein [Dysgonomonas sp. Marseille-P4677]